MSDNYTTSYGRTVWKLSCFGDATEDQNGNWLATVTRWRPEETKPNQPERKVDQDG